MYPYILLYRRNFSHSAIKNSYCNSFVWYYYLFFSPALSTSEVLSSSWFRRRSQRSVMPDNHCFFGSWRLSAMKDQRLSLAILVPPLWLVFFWILYSHWHLSFSKSDFRKWSLRFVWIKIYYILYTAASRRPSLRGPKTAKSTKFCKSLAIEIADLSPCQKRCGSS